MRWVGVGDGRLGGLGHVFALEVGVEVGPFGVVDGQHGGSSFGVSEAVLKERKEMRFW